MAPVSTWTMDESEFSHLDAAQCASLLTMGNGKLCTRGTPSEQRFGATRGTYHTGLYTLAPGGIPYLLCTPDWTPAWVSVAGALPNISFSRRVLDMGKGILRRTAILETGEFRLRIEEERFVSFVKSNLVCQRVRVIPERGTGRCEVAIGLDGEVRNQRERYYSESIFPVCDETGLRLSTIERCECDLNSQKIILRVPATGVRTMAAARITSGTEYKGVSCRGDDGRTLLNFEIRSAPDEGPFQFDKVAVVTADTPEGDDAVSTGGRLFEEYANLSYAEARIEHTNSVKKFWEQADVRIEGDESAQRAIRYSIWSTRIAAPNNAGCSSIGARNLCGDALRGGVYWDTDLLRMPFLSAVSPERAANHIRYRARLLPAARKRAAIDGYLGANFPYASRTVDYEKTYNECSHRTVFVNVSVARGILHYFAATNDESLMFESGLRILLEICLYLTSRIQAREDGSCGFASVEGPERITEKTNDEIFTNVAGAWVLRNVPHVCERLGKRQQASVESMMGALGITENTFLEWTNVADRIRMPDIGELRSREQHEERLGCRGEREFIEPDTEFPLRVSGDLLLCYTRISFPGNQDKSREGADWRAYAAGCRCRFASAEGVLASVAATLGYWEDAAYFIEKIGRLDASTITSGGIDGAVLAGLWSTVVQVLGGMQVDHDRVSVDPRLPPNWSRLSYRFLFRGIPFEVDIEPGRVQVTNHGAVTTPIDVAGKRVEISARETYTASVRPQWRSVGLKAVVFTLESLLPGLGIEELASPGLLSESVKQEIAKGLRPRLMELRKAGLSIGVIVGQQSSERIVEQLCIRDMIEAVNVVPVDSSRERQIYCLSETAHRLGVLPTHCVFVSGSAKYAAMSRDAGMIPVGLATPQSSEFRQTYTSIDEIDAESLTKLR